MNNEFQCPTCGVNIPVDNSSSARQVGCSSCGTSWIPPHLPSHTAAPSAAPAKKGPVIASWVMIGIICLLAAIPAFGFLMWFVAGPVLFITLVLGIVALAKGETTQGILILLATLIAAPAFILVAPLVTTGLTLRAAQPDTTHADFRQPTDAFDHFTSPVTREIPPNELPEEEATVPPRSSIPSNQSLHTIGDIVDLGDCQWEVLEAKNLGNSLNRRHPKTNGKFLYVKYKLTNVTNEEGIILITPVVRDSKNRIFDEMARSQIHLPEGETSSHLQVLPVGDSKVFSSLFEVPARESNFTFVARSLASSENEIPIHLEIQDSK